MSKSLSLTLIFDWECPLSEFSFFDVNSGKSYFAPNESDLFLAEYKSGIDRQLKEIIDTQLPVSIYFSGPCLEQLAFCDQAIIKAIKAAQHIEIIGGTFHHSLVSLFSNSHFQKEMSWHQQLIKKHFGKKPKTFLNTTNIYFNDLTELLAEVGYQSTFTAAIDWYLGEKKHQRIFSSRTNQNFKLMLTNQDNGHTLLHDDEVIHIFMQLTSQQLEGFGGWKEMVRKTKTKAEIVSITAQLKNTPSDTYNIRQPISSSYGNIDLEQLKSYPLQESWLKHLYRLEPSLVKKPENLQKKWSRLGSFGVLKSLNPELNQNETNSSYDVYQTLINILSDLQLKL